GHGPGARPGRPLEVARLEEPRAPLARGAGAPGPRLRPLAKLAARPAAHPLRPRGRAPGRPAVLLLLRHAALGRGADRRAPDAARRAPPALLAAGAHPGGVGPGLRRGPLGAGALLDAAAPRLRGGGPARP